MASWTALVVDDDAGIRQSLRLCLEADGARVLGVGAAPAAVEALDRARFDVVLLDLWLGKESGLDAIAGLLQRQPDLAIIVVTAFATFESAVEAMKRGAFDYLPKPFTPDQVRAATRRALDSIRLRQRLADAEQQLEQAGAADERFESENPAFRALLKQGARAAASDAPVLLRGESGTGKTALARWLWRHSTRKDGPFVATNLASSEALRHLQQAAGGTLFIDEVADLTLDAQANLLRFLTEHSEVRLITATQKNLDEEVRAGRFREDLLFRINVMTLVLPPLRERVEDLLPLAHHFLERTAARQRRPAFELSESARRAISAYSWPGNLRELRNAVDRAVISSPGPRIEVDDLGIPAVIVPAEGGTEVALGSDVSIEALEREHIARIIARAPTLEAAARTLGIDASTLQRKRKRYGLT
jgi:NtrC-family two-component system response regulator AlgB